MKSKLDLSGFSNRTVYMQNFLTDDQIKIGNEVANVHKYADEISGHRPYFLYFGRLSREKGILTLVQAFLLASGSSHWVDDSFGDGTNILEYIPENWDLHIVGDGPELSNIRNMLTKVGVPAARRIKLLGYKSGEELYNEIGNARFSVLPSQWYENMPYSGLESLAARTPIIGAKIGGIPEIVIQDETGYEFVPGNVKSLRTCLSKASQIGERKYASMQKACAKYAETACDQFTYIKMIQNQYVKLLH